ncbi:hypothetical protein ATER59S_00045 [Aquamicrobium terrae]
MSKIHEGGCACGAIRYEAKDEPVAEVHCQCKHCQARSGTGHSSYAVFAGPDAVTIQGEPKIWSVTGDSGYEKHHAFCANCGTPIHVTFAGNPAITAIHVGSLDRPEAFKPGFVTYGSRAQPWDTLDPTLRVFDKALEA